MRKEYTINEVAEMFQITANKIRFYEQKGLLMPDRCLDNGYRKFDEQTVKRLGTILMYRSIGCSIDSIKNILSCGEKETCLYHIHNQWNAVNYEIHRLGRIQKVLEKIIDTIYEEADLEIAENKMAQIMKENFRLLEPCLVWEDRWNFDGWAKNYDNSVRQDCGTLKIYQHYEAVLKNVYEGAVANQDLNSKILEIGVGTGNLTKKFLDSSYDIIGIDQSREMLNVAKEKFPKLRVRMGEFLKIPYENQSFDVIVSTYAFHHLNATEKQLSIREMLRVLKPGGKIVIGDLMFESKEAEKEIMQILDEEQAEEVLDEYYSHIDLLQKEFEKFGRTLTYKQIDWLNYVVEIE